VTSSVCYVNNALGTSKIFGIYLDIETGKFGRVMMEERLEEHVGER